MLCVGTQGPTLRVVEPQQDAILGTGTRNAKTCPSLGKGGRAAHGTRATQSIAKLRSHAKYGNEEGAYYSNGKQKEAADEHR